MKTSFKNYTCWGFMILQISLQDMLTAIQLLRGPGFEPEPGHVGSVVDRVTLRQVSSEYFYFPCRSFIPLIAPKSSSSITRAGAIGQQIAAVIVDSVPLQLHRQIKNYSPVILAQEVKKLL
jgi:hypothetical protein